MTDWLSFFYSHPGEENFILVIPTKEVSGTMLLGNYQFCHGEERAICYNNGMKFLSEVLILILSMNYIFFWWPLTKQFFI